MKQLLTTIFLLGLISSCLGAFIINRTITVDASTLAAMRGSVPKVGVK